MPRILCATWRRGACRQAPPQQWDLGVWLRETVRVIAESGSKLESKEKRCEKRVREGFR